MKIYEYINVQIYCKRDLEEEVIQWDGCQVDLLPLFASTTPPTSTNKQTQKQKQIRNTTQKDTQTL